MKQTRIATFFKPSVYSGTIHGMPVYDLFCGIGGFSCGAQNASHKVLLAVDNNETFLKCHAINHPSATHLLCQLPSDTLPLPPPDTYWHLHGSPPCTKLSSMNHRAKENETQDALSIVSWFFDLVIKSRPMSWSFEQVPHKGIISMLCDLKKKRPDIFDFEVINCVNFGIPQFRRRLIAGSPFVIMTLRQSQEKKKVSVRVNHRCSNRCLPYNFIYLLFVCTYVQDVLPNAPASFIRNSLYSRPDYKTGVSMPVPLNDKIRSIDNASYTILASGYKKWADEKGNIIRHLTAREDSIIQSFPLTYMLPRINSHAKAGVGNAVPPRLAELWMKPKKAIDKVTPILGVHRERKTRRKTQRRHTQSRTLTGWIIS